MDFILTSLYVSSCLPIQDHLKRIRCGEKKIGYTNGWNSDNYGFSLETTNGSRKLGILVKVNDCLLTVDSWTLMHFIHVNLRNGTLKLIGMHKTKWPNQGECYSVNAQQSILFEYQGVRFIMAVPFLRNVEILKTFKSDAFHFLNRINLDYNQVKLSTSLFMKKSRIWLNTTTCLFPLLVTSSASCESEKGLEQKLSQDKKNHFPVSGYLLLIWKAYAKILNRPFDQTRIILENVTIFRDLSLPRNGTPVHFQVNIVKKTGNFIIWSENLLLVRGTVRSLCSETKIGIKNRPFIQALTELNPKRKDTEMELELKWKGNWMHLFDSLLQILISNYGQSQILPTCGHLDKVILDPETFLNSVQDQSNLSFKKFPVYYQKDFFHSFTVKCEGIQFQGWKYKNDFTETNDNDYSLVIENIPYKDKDCPSYASSVLDQIIEKGTLSEIMKETRDTRDLKIISNIFRMEEKTHLRKSLQNLIIVDKEADFISSSINNSQFDLSLQRQTETDLFNTLSNNNNNNNSSNSNSNSSTTGDSPNCLTPLLDSLDKEMTEEMPIISHVSNEHETEKDDKITILTIESENTEESKIVEPLSTSSRMSLTLTLIQPSFTYIMYLFVLCTVGVLCTISLFLRTGIRIGFKLFKQTDKIKLMNQSSVETDEQSNISIIMKCSGVPVPSKMYKVLQGLVGNSNDGNILVWKIEKGLFFNYWRKDQNFDVKNHIIFETPDSQEENINLDNEAMKISEFYNNNHKWWSKLNHATKKPQWECRILYPQNSTNFLISFVAHTSYGNTLFFTKVIQKALSQFYHENPEIYAIYPVLKVDSSVHREQKQAEDKSRDKGQIESCSQRLFSVVTSTLTQVHNTILEMSQAQKGSKSKGTRKDSDRKVVEFVVKESQIKSSNIVNCLSKAFKKVSDVRRNRNNFAGGKKLVRNEKNLEEIPLQFLNVEKQLNFPHKIENFDNSWISTKIIPSLAKPFRYFVNFLLPSSFPGIPKTMIIFSRDHETVGSMINNEEQSVTLCVLDENQSDMNQHVTYFFQNFQKELDKIIMAQTQNFDIDRRRSNSDVVIPILDE